MDRSDEESAGKFTRQRRAESEPKQVQSLISREPNAKVERRTAATRLADYSLRIRSNES